MAVTVFLEGDRGDIFLARKMSPRISPTFIWEKSVQRHQDQNKSFAVLERCHGLADDGALGFRIVRDLHGV